MAENTQEQLPNEDLGLQQKIEDLTTENQALKKINESLEGQLKAKVATIAEPKTIKVGKKKYRFAFEAKRKGVFLTEELLRNDEKLAAEVVAEGSGVLVEIV